MRLLDLEPRWITHSQGGWWEDDDGTLTIDKAQGIAFLCPVCFTAKGGPSGVETILVWFRDRGVPDAEKPGPGRWTPSGTDFNNLSLTPSINVSNEHWHGWVKDGEVT